MALVLSQLNSSNLQAIVNYQSTHVQQVAQASVNVTIKEQAALGQSHQHYEYQVNLRMKTKKGFIELEYLLDEPIEDSSVENIKNILLKVAENIEIL